MFKNLISLLLVILISACYQALKPFQFYDSGSNTFPMKVLNPVLLTTQVCSPGNVCNA